MPLTQKDRAPRAKQRLLLVDDNEGLRKLFRNYFERHGYEATTAANAEETRLTLAKSTCSLVIFDLFLPDCDGMHLLAEVRAKYPSIPALVYTGVGFDEGLIQEARSHGAAGFLSKGLGMEQLLMEVHRVLDYRDIP